MKFKAPPWSSVYIQRFSPQGILSAQQTQQKHFLQSFETFLFNNVYVRVSCCCYHQPLQIRVKSTAGCESCDFNILLLVVERLHRVPFLMCPTAYMKCCSWANFDFSIAGKYSGAVYGSIQTKLDTVVKMQVFVCWNKKNTTTCSRNVEPEMNQRWCCVGQSNNQSASPQLLIWSV